MSRLNRNPNRDVGHLPRLAFGERYASVCRDLSCHAERLKEVIPGLECFDVPRRGLEFTAKSAKAIIGGLELVSNANTPLEVRVKDAESYNILIPVYGDSFSIFGGVRCQWGARRSGILLPPGERRGSSGVRSVVTINFDPKELQATIEAMLGHSCPSSVQTRLNEERVVQMHHGNLDFQSAFQYYWGLIDSYLNEPSVLEKLGVDDALYRLFGMLLFPEMLTSSENLSKAGRGKSEILKQLCEYIKSDIGSRHTLTDLERRSGFSARTLQNMFKDKFGVGPREWIVEQRLLEADARIRRGDYSSITGLALDMGFSSGAHFSRVFKERFGVSPRSAAHQRPG